jgi:hypothetical protein
MGSDIGIMMTVSLVPFAKRQRILIIAVYPVLI